MSADADAVANWGSESFFFTEAARGGPLAWRVGDDKLEGDALGPVRHAHDNASEYYFMLSGSAHVESGGHALVLEESELAYIPPDAPHNFTGPASDRDACLFCVVSPNLADNKWRVRDFKPEALHEPMTVLRPFEGTTSLPGDDKLTATAIALADGEAPLALTPTGFEVVYLVVDGTVDFSIANGLRGPLRAGSYLHLRESTRHTVSAVEPSKLLRIDCRFEAWKGVPTSADA